MSLNLNKVILAGRLTADPELKMTTNQITVTSFSLAVDRKTSKEAEKKTDFINVVAWRHTADFITKYFRKGSPICIVGTIQTRSWEDQHGNKRYATEVVADEASFVESKSSSEQSGLMPNVTSQTIPNFEEIPPDEDLPF